VNLPQAFRSRTAAVVTGAAALVLAATGGGAIAAGMVTSQDIQDGTIKAVDISDGAAGSRVIADGGVHADDLSDGVNSALSKAGTLDGTVYRIAHYSGGANAGAIATVACADTDAKSQKFIAIAGGVQVLNADGDSTFSNDKNPAVSDSFPGRMDYSNNTPKPDRLDGWIVRLGDTSGLGADQINIWAVCVPRPADVQVQTNNY
jgi:hypothetical protein